MNFVIVMQYVIFTQFTNLSLFAVHFFNLAHLQMLKSLRCNSSLNYYRKPRTDVVMTLLERSLKFARNRQTVDSASVYCMCITKLPYSYQEIHDTAAV